MFAFAGASTFPTIQVSNFSVKECRFSSVSSLQADMADRSKFNIAALIAMAILFLIYFPMAVGGYYSLGDEVLPSSTTPSPYQGYRQHCAGHACWLDEDACGGDAAASPNHSLPHHHQPPRAVLRGNAQRPIK